MFALGESGLGFALLGVLFLLLVYPASVYTLWKSLKGKRTPFMILCAWVAVIVGGIGSVGSVIDSRYYSQWEDIESILLGVLFSGFLFLAGIVALLKMKRIKQKEKEEIPSKFP